MRTFRAAVTVVAAALVAGSLAASGGASADARASGSCITSQLQPVPGGSTSPGHAVPVLFIHGIISSAQMWEPSTPGSIAYQAARINGVTAWTFNYAAESLHWVTSQAIGPNFATAISCLAHGSGNKVIIVAHSMGGLATQYALAQPDPYGGTVGSHVAEVITVGTPYRGSELLTAMQLARAGVDIDPSDYLQAALGDAVLSACAGQTSGICALPAVLTSQVGAALQLKSGAIAQLPPWPAGLPVLDIAGDMGLLIGVDHVFVLHRFDVGDVAVTVGSATAHDTTGTAMIKHCNSLKLLGAIYGNPGPCFHSNLVKDGDIITKILTAIKQYLASAQPTRMIDVAPVQANGQPKAGETIVNGGTAQSCEAGSDTAVQAYRCFVHNEVYDPCWLDNADPAQASVLCQEHPWDTRATLFKVASGGLGPFFGPAQQINLDFPWGVQLATGEQCVAVQGTHDSYEGKAVDYACGNNYSHVLLRTLNRSSPQWTYQSAYFNGSTGYNPGPLEHVTTAWYASPDNGAAVDAQADECTATALAYAAQAYEAAHNNPDGPLPDVNAQACDSGYAELVFTQTAIGTGYTAAMAFKASASGWQEIGKADFITPGQFGMPTSVGIAINKSLTSAPQTEQVPF